MAKELELNESDETSCDGQKNNAVGRELSRARKSCCKSAVDSSQAKFIVDWAVILVGDGIPFLRWNGTLEILGFCAEDLRSSPVSFGRQGGISTGTGLADFPESSNRMTRERENMVRFIRNAACAAVFAVAPMGAVQACDSPAPCCHYERVTTYVCNYETRTRWVTVTDHYGCPHQVPQTYTVAVRVPVTRLVKVCP
jgi:hypothetical protein